MTTPPNPTPPQRLHQVFLDAIEANVARHGASAPTDWAKLLQHIAALEAELNEWKQMLKECRYSRDKAWAEIDKLKV